jgi:hypothetical protein
VTSSALPAPGDHGLIRERSRIRFGKYGACVEFWIPRGSPKTISGWLIQINAGLSSVWCGAVLSERRSR